MGGQIIVQVGPLDIQAAPGGSPAPVRVDVFNAGRIVDQFWAGVLQAPEWLEAAPAMVSLFPDQRGSIELSFSIAEGRVVPAGIYPLTLRVVSASTCQVVHDQPMQLRVTPVFGTATLRLEPAELFGSKTATFQVEVSQGGNSSADVILSAEDPGGLLAFGFNPPRLAVPPLGSARALCSIWSRPPYFGDFSEHRFTVHAVGLQQPLEASGVFHQSPVFSPRRVRIMALALTFVGAVIVVLAAVLLAWTQNGAPTLYDGSLGGLRWDWQHVVQSFYNYPNPDEEVSITLSLLQSRWLSGGSIVIALAAIALFGAVFGAKRVARIASALVVVAIVALLIALLFREANIGVLSSGMFVTLVGGVIAFAGALLVRPLGRSIRMPKMGRKPKVPRMPKAPPMPKAPRTPTIR